MKSWLSGPASLTHTELVATLGGVLGRPLRYEEAPPEVARAQMIRFLPEAVTDSLLDWYRGSVGVPAEVSPTVTGVTGHPARTFAEWATARRGDFS